MHFSSVSTSIATVWRQPPLLFSNTVLPTHVAIRYHNHDL